jgi:hypothetical protein
MFVSYARQRDTRSVGVHRQQTMFCMCIQALHWVVGRVYLKSLVSVSGEAILLGFQHYIVMLGTAVMIPTMLVPRMGGDDVSAASLPP